MGAIRTLRAPGAAHLVAGTLLITLPTMALALGTDAASASAVAKGDNKAHATVRHHIRFRVPAARFVVKPAAVATLSGRTVVVRGRLLASKRNTEIKLIARHGRRWRTLADGRTHRGGRFHISYRVRSVGATPVRVRFDGSKRQRPTSAPAGQIVGLEPTVASWYYDAGNTACGFHATYGVANKTLPCGTKVTLSYGGRTVVATVDDRGPYVYGRSFDRDQTTSRYLGMYGVAQVFASV
jgi:rare lipoprotein A